ncbi:hypothetical protein GQ457_13G006620 [Hibiscus cannabinus]
MILLELQMLYPSCCHSEFLGVRGCLLHGEQNTTVLRMFREMVFYRTNFSRHGIEKNTSLPFVASILAERYRCSA